MADHDLVGEQGPGDRRIERRRHRGGDAAAHEGPRQRLCQVKDLGQVSADRLAPRCTAGPSRPTEAPTPMDRQSITAVLIPRLNDMRPLHSRRRRDHVGNRRSPVASGTT